MINVKETLKKLHKKVPMMGLDELFDVLDWYADYKIDTMPIKTNGVEFNKNSISCSTSNKIDRKYDGNITTTAEPSSIQFTTSH